LVYTKKYTLWASSFCGIKKAQMKQIALLLLCLSIGNFSLAQKQPKWLNTDEYPFKPHYFDAEGVRQHYIDTGTGPVILFVHGTPTWSYDFRHLIKELSSQYRCIAPDHIGFGLSEKPKTYNYSTEHHAERLSALIEHLDLAHFHLVVHDFGGPIAMAHAEVHPEQILSVTLVNTWLWSAHHDPAFAKLEKVLRSPLTKSLYLNFNFSARFLAPKTYGESKPNRITKRHFRKPFKRRSQRFGTHAFSHSLLTDGEWFDDLWKNRKMLEHIPKLIIWGKQDPALSTFNFEKLQDGFPEAKVVSLETAGHFPHDEVPADVLNALNTFLSNLL